MRYGLEIGIDKLNFLAVLHVFNMFFGLATVNESNGYFPGGDSQFKLRNSFPGIFAVDKNLGAR